MKTKFIRVAHVAGFFILHSSFCLSSFAQGTAFTYQGRLNSGAAPVTGLFDLRFAIYDAATVGTQQGNLLTNSATGVSNGLFTVALDFENQFPGANRWLEIGVRTNGGGAFTTLTTRQPLTATPYAITAGNVVSGGLASGTYGNTVTLNNVNNSFTGTFTGNGGGLTNANAASLDGLASSNFWQTGGNNVTPGKFLGSTNNQPVEIWANNQRAMQFAYASNNAGAVSANLIGGFAGNVVSNGVVGATVMGGGSAWGVLGTNSVSADYGTIVGGYGNTVSGQYGLAGGKYSTASGLGTTALGLGATASGQFSTALGQSTASGQYSTALGSSTASGQYSTALGSSYAISNSSTAMGGSSIASGKFSTAMGFASIASGFASTAMGDSTASGFASTAMGRTTTASGFASTAMGIATTASGDYSMSLGRNAQAVHQGSFVWGDSQSQSFASTANDQFCIRAQGGIQLDPATSIYFGNQTRQMLNLWSTNYGVGVQNNVEYFRTASKFYWYLGGAHSDTEGSSGGGSTMMTLNSAGLLVSGTIGSTSDRNVKTGFVPVDAKTILAKVAAMPITRWQFTNDLATAHVGPMAQDFYAAFNVGPDNKHITTIDESGVALAAIQGLNQKLDDQLKTKDAEIQQLKQSVAELKATLERLAHSQTQ